MPPRPWREDRPRPLASGPLVPINVVSVTTQRLVATALFFLLQGMKLAGTKNAANFLFFSALDAGFAYLLPLFAIPRLNFKSKVIGMQVATMLMINYTIFISSTWIWALLSLFFKPVLAIFGLTGKSKRSPYERGLITGKYVVDILPEASAKLDTIAPLCIHPQRKEPVYLQLSLDNTWPSAVQLSRAQLGNTSNYEHLSINKREISKLPKEQNNTRVYLPITEPGAYYLDKILDDFTGLRVKIQRDRIVIPPCPSVELVQLSDNALCENEEFKAKVMATGLAPLMVLIDDEYVSLGEKLEDDQVTTVSYEVIKKHNPSVSVKNIKDRMGSQMEVDKQVSAKLINPSIANIPGSQRLARVNDAVTAQMYISGDEQDAPFIVQLAGPNDSLVDLKFGGPGMHGLQVSDPGKYTLRSIAGSRCPGKASGEFEVFVPPPVSLNVEFNVVEDKCAGPSGVDAHINLEGSSPFKVRYRTLQGSRVISQDVTEFNGAEGFVQFRPKSTGEYWYEIIGVEDSYRHLQFSSRDENFGFAQRIKELPGAQFKPLPATKLCGSTKIPVEVLVYGRGPFNLKYSIDDDKEFTVATGEFTDQDLVRLDLDFPEGNHYLRLLSLTDRNGCVTKLPGIRTPDIYVQPHFPLITWNSPGEFKSAEPVNETLALKASNLKYPAKLVYERLFSNKKTQETIILRNADDAVKANQPGVYRLISLDDGTCGGNVNQDAQIKIGLYERPHLEVIDESIPSNLCVNSKSLLQTANIKLHGEAPFIVVHEYVDPQGKSHTQTHKLSKTELKLSLDTSFVGQYKHYLWIMDSWYPEFYRPQYTMFKHTVHPTAEAIFAVRNKKLQVCENDSLPQPLPVALKGQAPFELTLQIDREIKVVVVEQPSKLDLRQFLGEFKHQGAKKLKILAVNDANGCKSSTPIGNEVDLQVLPQPKLPMPQNLEYCVGEKISFSVSSTPSAGNQRPRVDYIWDKKQHSLIIPEKTNMFEKFALKPGNLSVVSITDPNGCKNVLSIPQIVARVHPLPRSTITEQPHFSIYQGDQISLGFAFEGTAPFSFVYTRSVGGNVKERKEVKNIMENEYNIIVDEGGEYEIIELRDKFCRSGK